MNRRKTNLSRLSILAAGAIGAAVAGAAPAAAQQPEIPQGWFKECSKGEDIDICSVQNIVYANTGQVVTAIGLIERTGKMNERLLQVTVLSGRRLPPGIGMQVDGGQAQKLDYVVCMPDRCIAQAPLTDQIINSFKRGSQLVLTSVNFQNQPNPIQVSLQGFTSAYDGDPLPPSDIEERQRRVQEFISRNTDDFTQRLREEQARARQGGEQGEQGGESE